MVGALSQLVDSNNKPLFSVKFLAQKYLKFTEDDLRLNKSFLEAEELEKIEQAKRIRDHQKWNQEHQQAAPAGVAGAEGGGAPDFGGGDFGGLGGGDDFGGGGDFGGGAEDFGGGSGADFGGGGGGADALVGGSEPEAAGGGDFI